MTNQEQESVLKTLKVWIRQNGPIPLRNMRSILKESGIPAAVYEEISPKKWVTAQFPELIVVGTNGLEQIVIPDKVLRVLSEALDKFDGRFPLAAVPQLLHKNGVEWRDRANGKRLSEWLLENYSMFAVVDDRLCMRGDSFPPQPSPQPDQSTKSYVRQFCYFPASADILAQIRELTGDNTLTQNAWNARRTTAFARCLLGLNGGLLDAADAQPPRMAFFTGCRTALNQDIYGILTTNDSEEAVQPWTCTAFCFPGQIDANGYGQWLCRTFGLPSQITYGQDTVQLLESVKLSFQTLRQLHAALLDMMEPAKSLVSEGRPLPADFSDAVLQYANGWNSLMEALRGMDMDIPEDSCSLEAVEGLISQQSDSTRIDGEITERFHTVAAAAWEYMTDNMLCPENRAETDLSRWDGLLREKSRFIHETTDQLRNLLEPFRALQTLSDFGAAGKPALSGKEYQAMECINEHFESQLNAPGLRLTIFREREKLSFLDLLPEIDSLLITLESSGCSRETELDMTEITDSGLLRLALEGKIWSVLDQAFPAPNPLETAAMLGNTEEARRLIGDAGAMDKMGYGAEGRAQMLETARVLQFSNSITPVCAAERLESLLGPDCRQIDRCLFLGVAQGEKGAAEHLLSRCLNRRLFDLAHVLYESRRGQLDAELRDRCLLALLVSGEISLQEAVQDNILVLLTDEGIETVSAMTDPGGAGLRADLQALYADIQPTLVHHVVFLSRDLQSYILRPENQPEFSEYHLDMSESGIPALLKRESYARGASPLQVAMRVEVFLGGWNDIARRFALLDSNTTQRQGFLVKLAMSGGDIEQASVLLAENQELQQQNMALYRQVLYQTQNYPAFCRTVDPEELPELPVQTALQLLIAQLRSGRWTGMLPVNDPAEIVAHPELLLELGQELAARDPEKHGAYLTALFPQALLELPEQQLHQLVTANGALDDKTLLRLAGAGVKSCPALTVYCCKLLGTDDFAEEREAYLDRLYDGLNHAPLSEQYRIARELRLLDPDRYAAGTEKLIETQVCSILEEDAPDEQKAEALSSLLRANPVSGGAYLRLLERLSGGAPVALPPLYQTLLDLADSEGGRTACLRLLHQYRGQGGEEFCQVLCGQYVELTERGQLPGDLLVESEAVLLSRPRQKFDPVQRVCVYRMERTRGRRPFILFALNALMSDLDEMLTSEVWQELTEDAGRFSVEDGVSELELFCQVLEDEQIDIGEYLSFCSMFVAPENPDEVEDTGNVESDVLSVLHTLYHHPQDSFAWNACVKLPFQDRTAAYANALYHSACFAGQDGSVRTGEKKSAGSVDDAWEKCAVYCLAEGQDSMFFRAIHRWIQTIDAKYTQTLPWYAVRHFVQTIQGLLDADDPLSASEMHTMLSVPRAFPICGADAAGELLSDLIRVFKRIDQEESNRVTLDGNHNTLRLILEFGVKLDCEQMLIRQLFDELTGSYVNLGLSIICRLLLVGKYAAAMDFLPKFVAQSRREYNYLSLVNRLAKLKEPELLEWLHSEGNRATLRFILPNGNAPDVLRLQTLVMSGIAEGTSDTSLAVIENLLDCYPKDVMCHTSLFILCKENYEGHLPQLIRSLYGVYKYCPSKGRHLFTRSRKELIRLITILRSAMEMKGYTDLQAESVTELIRSYSQGADDIDQTVSEQNRLAEEIRSLFVGVTPDSLAFELHMNALLGSVTGNWLPFLTLAYRKKLTQWVQTYNVAKYSRWGLARSVLRAWREQPSGEERDRFAEWIQKESAGEGRDSLFYKFAGHPFQIIMRQVAAENVNWDILRLPWEEHFVCLGNLKDVKRPERNSCYKWMMLMRPKDRPARDSFTIMIRLAQDQLKVQLLSGNAEEWFKSGDYELAAASYDALYLNRQIPVRGRTPEEKNRYFIEYMERYQTWSRIAHIFSGQIQPENMTVHSCYNIIVSLLNENYVRHYDRLRGYFVSGANRELFNMVRHVLTTPISDDELMEVSAAKSNRALLVACLRFLLSKDTTGKYLFLTDAKQIGELRTRLRRQEEALPDAARQKFWIPLTVRPDASRFPPLTEEEPAAGLSAAGEDAKAVFSDGANGDAFEPAFLMDAEELCLEGGAAAGDAAALEAQYVTLTPYSDIDYSKRLRISAQLYLLTQADGSNTVRQQQSVVQFGVDYYLCHRGRVGVTGQAEKERGHAHRAMLDLARYGLNTPAVSMIVAQQLPNWFQYSVRGFTSMDSLLEDFCNNQRGYAAVSRLLSDSEHANAANGILEMLKELLAVSNRLGTRNIDTAGYQAAQSRLNDLTFARDWNEMRSHLNELLRKALNQLDQRPSLRIKVFNSDLGMSNDSLYGQIENTGRKAALDLNLQATFPNNQWQSISACYHFSELQPNETVAFAVRYTADEGVLELEYTLSLSYRDQRSEYTAGPVSGVLAISPNVEAPAVIPQFNTTQASAFTIDEDGQIVSRDFKGRKTETQKLIGLLRGDSFAQYQSAIVQGIKRSGKTSLLNYLRTYIRAKKGQDTIQLWFDCQNLTKQYVYSAFFRPALEELPLEYPQIVEHPGWKNFVSTWQCGPGDPDRDPGELSIFYRQLHGMLDGKGIFLIVDEFDVLLGKLETPKDMDIMDEPDVLQEKPSRSSGFDGLLKALRGLQMNPDCFDAIHLILCGSNHLLTYNRVGSYINQMFQSYELIQVGQMQTKDIGDMIRALLEDEPSVHFDNDGASIQWIERYTGGLVWYTRLLVNEVIKNVLRDGRNCVYPADVCDAFDSICSFQNCRQFTEGCSQTDLVVLDAVQGLADRFGKFVSADQIAQRLKTRLTPEQLAQSLALLTDTLELLERKAPNSKMYRFRVEIYRRYFRLQAGTETQGDCFKPGELSVKTDDADSEFEF